MDLAKSLRNVIALANQGIRTMPGMTEESLAEVAYDIVLVKQHLATLTAPAAADPAKP